jgi:hypothetical protein
MPTLRYRFLTLIIHLVILSGWNISAFAQTTFAVPNVPGCSGVSGVIVNMRGGSGGASNSTGTSFPNGGAGGFGGSIVCTLNVYSPVIITSLTTYVGNAGAVGVPVLTGILGPTGGTGYGTGGNGGNFVAPSSAVGTNCPGGAGGGSSAVLNTTGAVPLLVAGGGGGGGALITTLTGGNGGNPATAGGSAGSYNLGGSGGSPGTFGAPGGIGISSNGFPAGPAPGNGGNGGIGPEGSQSGGGGGAGYGGGGGGGAGNLPGVGSTIGVNTATGAGGGGSNYVAPGTITTGLVNGTAGVTGNGIVTLTLFPAAIGGTCITLCPGTSTTFTESTPGGTWSSSNSAIASVSATTGSSITVTAGTSVGTADISYTVGGYWAFVKVTVVASTEPITGPANVCVGQTITLADVTPAGTWSSSPAGIVTVSATGVLTGVSAGVATITYTPPGGCIATTTVTVTPLPGPIGGTLSVCMGSTTTLTNSVPGGTWSSFGSSIATIDPTSGIVSALTPGAANITYSFGGTCFVSGIVTINALPVATVFDSTGPTTCFGSDGAITLNGLISGTTYKLDYSFNGSPVATLTLVADDGKIVATGLAAGTYSNIYVTDVSTGCVSVPVGPVTLSDPPNPPAPVITSNLVCLLETLFLKASDAWTGGVYSWTGPNGFTSTIYNPTIISTTYADTGIYTVVYTRLNCASLPTDVDISMAASAFLTNVTLSQTISYGSSIQLDASNAAYYMWEPHDGSLDNPNINNPVATPLLTTTYIVHGRNPEGCPDTASVTITVDSTMNEFIPSGFTPIGDKRYSIQIILNMAGMALLMVCHRKWAFITTRSLLQSMGIWARMFPIKVM